MATQDSRADRRPLERAPPRQSLSDLLPRLISGAILALAAVAMTVAGPVWFSVFVTAAGLIVGWEWCRMVQAGQPTLEIIVLIGATILIEAALATMGADVLALLAGVIGFFVVAIRARRSEPLLTGLGALYVGLPVIGLISLRRDSKSGLEAVMFVFVTVWVLDTAAYFVGRMIGGPKLAPTISPNKTWSGFLGGVLAAGIAGGLVASALPPASALGLAGLSVLLAIVAQGGDLGESALKRYFGVKDSSGLIPGHGGFMDRLDGTMTAAPVAAIIGHVLNASAPAHGLLHGF